MDVKSFITLAPGPNVMKPLSVIYDVSNKLECLSLANFLSLFNKHTSMEIRKLRTKKLYNIGPTSNVLRHRG